MDLRLLRYFHAVARLKNFTKAADVLFISQPALSQGVKALEKELHCELFIRGKQLQLTLEGNKLFAHCESLFEKIEQIVEDISDTKGSRKARINIGVLDSILLYWLPEALADFFHSYPGVSLNFSKSETKVIEGDLLDEKLDLGIISRPTFSRNLEEFELGSFSHQLVVSSEFKEDFATLAKTFPLYTIGDWQEKVLRTRTTVFQRATIKTLNPANCVSLIRQIVARKLGMAVLPSYTLGADLRVIEEFPDIRMGLYLIRKRDCNHSKATENFVKFLTGLPS